MRQPLLPLAALLVPLTLASCLGDVPDPVSPDDALPSFHHRPGHAGGPGSGNGNGDGDPEGGNLPLRWTFDESEGLKIVSDGRAGGPYVDGECGVSAIVNVEGSGPDSPGDALLRAAWRNIHPRDANACGGRDARSYSVHLDAPLGGAEARSTKEADFANINDVEWVTEGPDEVNAAFNLSGCNLRMGPRWEGTDPVRVTPVHDGGGGLTGWIAESTGDHVATCAVFPSPSEPLEPGDLFRVPFRVEIGILDGAAAFPF